MLGRILKKAIEVTDKLDSKSTEWGEKVGRVVNDALDKASDFVDREIIRDDLIAEIEEAEGEFINSLIDREHPACLTRREKVLLDTIKSKCQEYDEMFGEETCDEECCCCEHEQENENETFVCEMCGAEISSKHSFCTACGAAHITADNAENIIKRKFFSADGKAKRCDIILKDDSLLKSRAFEALLPDGTLELKNTRGTKETIHVTEIKDIQ